MGTSRSPAEFVGKIHKVGQATDRHRKQAVTEAAFAAKKMMLATAAANGVSPGGKIARRPWGVSYSVRGGELPTAIVKFTGPFHLVNNDTLPHYIAAGGLGGSRTGRSERAFAASVTRFQGGSARGAFAGQRKSRGKRSLKFGISNYAYVFHPGTKGKRIFQTVKPLVIHAVPEVMAHSMKGAWKRALT